MPTLVSLFSGAGGLDIGLEQAGLTTVAATDADTDCIQTLKINRNKLLRSPGGATRRYLSEAEVVHADVAELSAADLRPLGADGRWQPDLLVGGPPCQPFSSSGKQLSILERRGRLFVHFVRLATELNPRAILFENVRGIVTARGVTGEPGEVLAEVREAFESIGYASSFALMNAADFGCPQRRVRLFMLATHDAPLPVYPQPSHTKCPDTDLFNARIPWRTLGDFLDDIPSPDLDEVVRPTESLAKTLADVKPGSGVKSPGRAEPTRPGGHWGYRQGTFVADPDLPARTVTASASQDWIKESDGLLRRLTLRECAALQGFPYKWRFAGNKASQFRQVGNAVPAVFGRVLGHSIIEALRETTDQRPRSAPLPSYMAAAVAYTKRDHERNSVARARTNAILREIGSLKEVV